MNKPKKRLDGILQHGEATGHYHRATGEGVEVMERDEEVWMLAPNGAIVTHQEHNSISLPADAKGYDRKIVREYDHFFEESREVVD